MKYSSQTTGLPLALLLIFLSLTGKAQTQQAVPAEADPATLTKALDQYRLQHLQEKLFVHTDKELYWRGGICWFKLIVLGAGSPGPLEIIKGVFRECSAKKKK